MFVCCDSACQLFRHLTAEFPLAEPINLGSSSARAQTRTNTLQTKPLSTALGLKLGPELERNRHLTHSEPAGSSPRVHVRPSISSRPLGQHSNPITLPPTIPFFLLSFHVRCKHNKEKILWQSFLFFHHLESSSPTSLSFHRNPSRCSTLVP